MGMYDSVFMGCPGCGASLEFQSKAGDCNLASYSYRDVPLVIAADIEGDTEQCQECGVVVTITAKRGAPTGVPMFAEY